MRELGKSHLLNDAVRIAALRRADLLDTPAEPCFDRLTRLTSRLLRAPVALVSLVDADRQFFKSCVGLPEPWATMRETPLSHSFCQHVVISRVPLIIEDAREHPLVRKNKAISALGVVAYAGFPLITENGHALGSFCAIDRVPRKWSEDEVSTLGDIAQWVMTEIALRLEIAARKKLEDSLRRQRDWLHGTLAGIADAVIATDEAGKVTFMNLAAEALCGWTASEATGKPLQAIWVVKDRPVPRGTHLDSPDLGSPEEGLGRQTVLVSREGIERAIRDNASPIYGADGSTAGVVLIFREVDTRPDLVRRLLQT